MFKVKATVVDFLGDKKKYPCHHQYKLGDEFVFDGEKFIGTICPSFAISVVPMMMELHSAGPRYRDYLYYYPFLYSPKSVEDPDLKKYDGIGFRNVFEEYKESKHSMANLAGRGSFKWPPPETRTAHKEVSMICPDYRTSVLMKLEAFDLSDKGRNIPYFRREMVILDKIIKNPGINAEKILDEFPTEQIKGIYPALSMIMVKALLEEMELMGYIEFQHNKVYASQKAEARLKDFVGGLSKEEREALGI